MGQFKRTYNKNSRKRQRAMDRYAGRRNEASDPQWQLGIRLRNELASDNPRNDVCLSLIGQGAVLIIESLFAAIRSDRRKIVRVMIDKGLDVNDQNDDGMTGLMYAAMMRRPEIAKILIENDADVDRTAKNGKTALDYAQSNNARDIADMIVERRREIKEKLDAGCPQGEERMSAPIPLFKKKPLDPGNAP